MISDNGSINFFANRGSSGTSEPNNLTTLINTQLLLDAIKHGQHSADEGRR
jgi:hypothetical protein